MSAISSLKASKRPGATTLRDVARHAGVSPITASRALSNNAPVAEATRAAVMRAVEELSYRPNLSARGMRQSRSRMIGALVQNNPDQPHTHPLTYEFLLGVNQGLDDADYMMSMIRLTDVKDNAPLGAKALEGHLLDGVIVVNYVPDPVVARLDQMAPPCVWLDGNVWRDERCIRRDEYAAGALVTQKLVDAGYRQLILARRASNTKHFSIAQRADGARETAARAGATLREVRVDETETGHDFSGLMPQLHSSIGLIMPDIYMARAFAFFLADQNARAGRDFAVVCCDDDIAEPSQIWHKLARASFDRFDMGRQAAEMMLDILRDPDADCASRLIQGRWLEGTTLHQQS